MPTYDYACKACRHTFEHFQPMGDKLLRTCPECGKRQLERLIGSGSGIVFKGSGFYETDYKRKSGKPESDAPAKTSDAKTGAKDTKSKGAGAKDSKTKASKPKASDD